jgi:LPXTG-site transpeptidase (sortase) family protein
MKKKSLYIRLFIGIALIAVGMVLWHLRTSNAFTDAQPSVPQTTAVAQAPKSATITGSPMTLNIPSLKMSLPVINGYYDKYDKEWTLTLDKVQYATVTPPPNNAGGNTFLYGHYRPEVFAYLHLIKIGATATITTANHHTFTYQLTNIHVTTPNDDSLFNYQGPPILTIQTCTGTFFQYRQLFTFKLVSAT